MPSAPVQALTEQQQRDCYSKWGGANGVTLRGPSESGMADPRWSTWQNDPLCNPKNNSSSTCKQNTIAGTGSGMSYRIVCTSPDEPYNPCSEASYNAEECRKQRERQRGVVDCPEEGDCAKRTSFEFCGKNTAVGMECLVQDVLRFMSILVGILVVGGVIVGGIVYSTSQGNPGQTQKGITIIANSIIGLVIYLLMFVVINWLLPGSVITP